ncbi:TetR/AcrR family transcriptional regulator [Bacillus sp. EB600]|uniref:TetR/AcrR family transcriptional regulator n=1 Tax=Bacillus sp. EB600 TaxID=2806345 RepID=UPI00210C79C6|nr:TetR/AcrR family transcriptional regulator [Bacillus sp. EB600]MCQ6280310.1 TetR/AcrR family transcriptional regulator [Bacillus sp. EB600]
MAAKSLMELALAQAKNNKKMTEKQQKIVETAIQMFAEKGYASTSTNEIAKAAGVAEGTIFRHFGSKENLLLSVILPFLLDAVPVVADEFINEVLTKPYHSFESFLATLIENRLEFVSENKQIFKILVVELLHRDELREQLISFFQQAPYQHISAILDTFKQRGELVDLPNPTLIRTVLTQVFGYFMVRFALFPTLNWDDSLDVDQLVQVILKGIGKRN